jgi:NAD(P)-dependent dehydrogenase (short-subunit alcohol dehydrogenase family)
MEVFKDKVAVVTGAASGIGRGLAERFAAEGMRVVLADVEAPALAETERALRQSGGDVLAVRTDVSDPAQVQALAEETLERFGGVHVLCNNAGVGSGALSWEEPLDDWRWVLGVNLWGVIHGIRAFAPLMLRSGEDGHIVNTASVAGLMAGGGAASYTASKFAVVGLSEVLYHEMRMLSGGRIGVSVLCPAATDTQIVDADRNRPGGRFAAPAPGSPEEMGREMIRQVLRAGQSPAEVAGKVLDAIRERRFYVLTHPEHNGVIAKRADAITNGLPPPSLIGG